MTVNEREYQSASDLFSLKKYIISRGSKKTERGIFLEKFAEKTKKPLGYIALRLQGIPTTDLYYIEKQCDNYKGEWSKCFWGMLKPR
jgi:hypothetical protein